MAKPLYTVIQWRGGKVNPYRPVFKNEHTAIRRAKELSKMETIKGRKLKAKTVVMGPTGKVVSRFTNGKHTAGKGLAP